MLRFCVKGKKIKERPENKIKYVDSFTEQQKGSQSRKEVRAEEKWFSRLETVKGYTTWLKTDSTSAATSKQRIEREKFQACTKPADETVLLANWTSVTLQVCGRLVVV